MTLPPNETTLVELLGSLGVVYEIVDCDPALADTAEFCAAYGYDTADSANTIGVVGKGDPRVYAACVVLADSRLDVNGVVRKRFGTRKASFASGDETVAITGMLIGGVSPPTCRSGSMRACSNVNGSCSAEVAATRRSSAILNSFGASPAPRWSTGWPSRSRADHSR